MADFPESLASKRADRAVDKIEKPVHLPLSRAGQSTDSRRTVTIPRRPYSEAKRIGYGLVWVTWTLLLFLSTCLNFSGGDFLAGLVCLALTVIAGRYAYRIWTYKARRLWILIVFVF